MINHKRLVFFSLSLFFLFCFFAFSFLVKKHYLTQFDFDMSVRIQDNTPVKLDKLYQFFSALASVQGMAILLSLLLVLRRQIIRGFIILSIFFSSHIVELFGKLYINHPPPPFMFYKHIDASTFNFNKYYVQTGNSYPSGHSLRTVFFAVIFAYTVYHMKRIPPMAKTCLILGAVMLVCFVGISRVSLGEHWTTDVIGGGLFGLASGIFSLIFL